MIIRTYKLRPTDHLGERIRARIVGNGKQITVSWDYGLKDPHQDAAEKLAGGPVERVTGKWTSTGYVFQTVEQ